jgi:hypothetical protein
MKTAPRFLKWLQEHGWQEVPLAPQQMDSSQHAKWTKGLFTLTYRPYYSEWRISGGAFSNFGSYSAPWVAVRNAAREIRERHQKITPIMSVYLDVVLGGIVRDFPYIRPDVPPKAEFPAEKWLLKRGWFPKSPHSVYWVNPDHCHITVEMEMTCLTLRLEHKSRPDHNLVLHRKDPKDLFDRFEKEAKARLCTHMATYKQIDHLFKALHELES